VTGLPSMAVVVVTIMEYLLLCAVSCFAVLRCIYPRACASTHAAIVFCGCALRRRNPAQREQRQS
jgi:hypothetical protein